MRCVETGQNCTTVPCASCPRMPRPGDTTAQRPSQNASSERVAQLLAHRAVGNQEQDTANGKLAGYCAVCQVPWPCQYAGTPPSATEPKFEAVGFFINGDKDGGWREVADRHCNKEGVEMFYRVSSDDGSKVP